MNKGVFGPEEALNLTKQGRSVTIVEMLDRIGTDFGRSYRWVIMQSLRQHNVKMIAKTECLEIDEKGLVISKEGQREILDVDTVVVATGYQSSDRLYTQLQGKVSELVLIGDAKEPRKCLEAVYEGAKIGREI